MTTADLVNLIIEKLRTGRVEFIFIGTFFKTISIVDFKYGGTEYSVEKREDKPLVVTLGRYVPYLKKEQIGNATIISHELITQDNYTRWIQSVLRGEVRDDDGNMVPK